MKLLSIVLCLLLLTGCGAAQKLDAAEEVIENYVETTTPVAAPDDLLTEDDMIDIALNHAGVTPDQIQNLFISYEIDDNTPVYDVEFQVDMTEYEYTLHGKTGEILSYDIGD